MHLVVNKKHLSKNDNDKYPIQVQSFYLLYASFTILCNAVLCDYNDTLWDFNAIL